MFTLWLKIKHQTKKEFKFYELIERAINLVLIRNNLKQKRYSPKRLCKNALNWKNCKLNKGV